MKSSDQNLMQVHFAVLLFGVSGLFAKLLDLPSMTIVFFRVVFSGLFLLLVLSCSRSGVRLREKRQYGGLILLGALLAVHWTSFYQSIKLSSVAVGLLTFSTFPVFVTFLEPLLTRERLKRSDVLAAGVTFAGVLLVVPGFRWESGAARGALLGIFSGLTYALLSLMNRRYAAEYSGLLIAFYEQSAAAVFLLPFCLWSPPAVTGRDLLLLAVLGVVFTGAAHSLFISGLRRVRAQTAGIISCLEPVYGIFLAWLILGEVPSMRELFGGAVILGAVFYSTVRYQKNAGAP